MCTNIIKAFDPIIYKENLSFTSTPIVIPYIGPTLTIKGKSNKTVLKSKDNYTFDTKGDISLVIQSDLCISDNGPITTYGNIEISSLQAGPFSTIDSTLELNFRQLFFNLDKLVIPVNIEIYASKDIVCKESDKQKALDEIEVHVTLATEKKILFDNYFVTNSNNIKNINFLFYDLKNSFSVYQSIYGKFGIFYEKLISGLLLSTFGTNIKNQMIDIICSSSLSSLNSSLTNSTTITPSPTAIKESLSTEIIEKSIKNNTLHNINIGYDKSNKSDIFIPITIAIFIIFMFIIKYIKGLWKI